MSSRIMKYRVLSFSLFFSPNRSFWAVFAFSKQAPRRSSVQVITAGARRGDLTSYPSGEVRLLHPISRVSVYLASHRCGAPEDQKRQGGRFVESPYCFYAKKKMNCLTLHLSTSEPGAYNAKMQNNQGGPDNADRKTRSETRLLKVRG